MKDYDEHDSSDEELNAISSWTLTIIYEVQYITKKSNLWLNWLCIDKSKQLWNTTNHNLSIWQRCTLHVKNERFKLERRISSRFLDVVDLETLNSSWCCEYIVNWDVTKTQSAMQPTNLVFTDYNWCMMANIGSMSLPILVEVYKFKCSPRLCLGSHPLQNLCLPIASIVSSYGVNQQQYTDDT